MSTDLRSLPKLKPAIKKRWLKALRSDKYKQGEGQLCTVNEDGSFKYCCLGVLADVVKDDKGLKIEWETDSWNDRVIDGCSSVIENDSRIAEHVLAARHDGNWLALTVRNDGEEYTAKLFKPQSFKQIANHVERYM